MFIAGQGHRPLALASYKGCLGLPRHPFLWYTLHCSTNSQGESSTPQSSEKIYPISSLNLLRSPNILQVTISLDRFSLDFIPILFFFSLRFISGSIKPHLTIFPIFSSSRYHRGFLAFAHVFTFPVSRSFRTNMCIAAYFTFWAYC